MKIRKNRVKVLHINTFPKLLILGKKDGVLNYDTNIKQIEGTSTILETLADGHMSHIENKDELTNILNNFFKTIKVLL